MSYILNRKYGLARYFEVFWFFSPHFIDSIISSDNVYNINNYNINDILGCTIDLL